MVRIILFKKYKIYFLRLHLFAGFVLLKEGIVGIFYLILRNFIKIMKVVFIMLL